MSDILKLRRRAKRDPGPYLDYWLDLIENADVKSVPCQDGGYKLIIEMDTLFAEEVAFVKSQVGVDITDPRPRGHEQDFQREEQAITMQN